MEKNVQIPYDLFLTLVKIHCMNCYTDHELQYASAELEKKLNKMAERQRYAKALKDSKK